MRGELHRRIQYKDRDYMLTSGTGFFPENSQRLAEWAFVEPSVFDDQSVKDIDSADFGASFFNPSRPELGVSVNSNVKSDDTLIAQRNEIVDCVMNFMISELVSLILMVCF